MKFYYSIIKICPNTSSQDSLSIGLLAFNTEEARFLVSEHRKSLARKLVNPALVDFICKELKTKVNKLNVLAGKNEPSIFEPDYVFDPEYINYLSNYSNGVLQISKASVCLAPMTSEILNNLFEALIDKLDVKESASKKGLPYKELVEQKLINRVKEKVHTNIKFDHQSFANLYFSFEMECIGLNGAFVGAKAVDFTSAKNTIDTTVSHYGTFITLLTLKHSKSFEKNNFFLIAEEPADSNTGEYMIWEALQKNPLLKVIHPEQSELVAEKIEETKAGRFI